MSLVEEDEMAGDAPWRPVPRLRTHEQVLAQIEERILDGKLRIGDKLPAERELVENLGVSRASVREALRVLESMGIIEPRRGRGPEAGSAVSGRPSQALTNLLRLHMALSEFTQEEVLGIRIQIERGSAYDAAAKATAEQVAELRSLIEEMQSPEIDRNRYLELDMRLHVKISHVGGNKLAGVLMASLRDVLYGQMVSAFEQIEDWKSTAARLTVQHQQIVDSIEKHNGEAAAAAVSYHITSFYQR